MSVKNIVLIHGWEASVHKFYPLRDELKKLGWNVFIPRLPGFDLKNPKSVWGLNNYSIYVEKRSNNYFKDKKHALFGHSFGGRIAISIAAGKNKNINGMVLCAPGGITRTGLFKRLFFMVIAKTGKVFLLFDPSARIFKKLLYKVAREHDYEKAVGIKKEILKKIVNENITSRLKYITISTLVLWGDADNMTSVKGAAVLNRKINNSKLKIYTNVGHKLPYEKPKDVAETIDDWFINK